MFACVLTSSNMNTMIALTHSLCDGLVSISRTFACLLFVVCFISGYLLSALH